MREQPATMAGRFTELPTVIALTQAIARALPHSAMRLSVAGSAIGFLCGSDATTRMRGDTRAAAGWRNGRMTGPILRQAGLYAGAATSPSADSSRLRWYAGAPRQ